MIQTISLCVLTPFDVPLQFNFSVYFLNSWSPLYYSERHSLKPDEIGIHLMLPHLFNLFVKMFVSKPLFAALQHPSGYCRFTLLACRRFFTVVGFLGSTVSMVVLALNSTAANDGADGAGGGRDGVWLTTACSTVAMGFVALHPSGFKANYMDLTLNSSGLLSGVGNTLASAGAYVGPLVVGHILQQYKSWALVYYTIGATSVLTAAVFGLCSQVEPVDKED